MVCFRKGGGRRRKTDWEWEGQKIEEVKTFKYLGYVVKKNGGQEGQIKELMKKGNVVLQQVWGLGERRFRDDFKRRMMLFKYLVLGVIMYGVEVWGWEKGKNWKEYKKRYIKWTLNLDSCTPDYIVYKETNIERIGTIARSRAVRFEEKAIRERYRKLVVECVKEKEREGNEKTLISDRERFYRENGYSTEGIKSLREKEMNVVCVVRERERERLGQWLEEKIIEKTKYNERYKEIKVVGLLKYLRTKGIKGSQKLIARWRCGNEEERNKYWLTEKKRRCLICKEEE